MDRIYVREGPGIIELIIKLLFFAPIFIIPVGAAGLGVKALIGMHWHPALILLAAIVALGILGVIVCLLAAALPRVMTAIGVLYCTVMYGLTAYNMTQDPIWCGVIALFAALLSWQPVGDLVRRAAK